MGLTTYVDRLIPARTAPDLRCSTLKKVEELSQKMLAKSIIARFTDKGEDSKMVAKLIERLREAIVCYQVGNHCASALSIIDRKGQVSQQQAIYRQITHLTVRLPVLPLKPTVADPFLKASFDALLKLQEVI